MFVSISKSNRSSTSKEHRNSTPSKSQLSESDFKHLDGLSRKRYIVEKVENQI
jgi:hypothetical protein